MWRCCWCSRIHSDVLINPLGSIALPVTFGTEENFRMENVVFVVAEVNLPFNAIIGRPALYRFMAIAHYGYLVIKMSSPTGILTVRGDHAAGVTPQVLPKALAQYKHSWPSITCVKSRRRSTKTLEIMG
jgi:hypothetical protein